MARYNITNNFIKNLKPPKNGYKIYADNNLKGFGVLITSNNSISFILRTTINKTEKRITLGSYSTLNLSEARKKAMKIKIDNSAIAIKPLLLNDLCQEYIDVKAKQGLSAKTIKDYSLILKNYILNDLGLKKIINLTKNDLYEMQNKLKHIKYSANRALELIKASLNYAIEQEYITFNVASKIKKFKEESRERFLYGEELIRLLNVVNNYPCQTIKDYILISLYTGARKSNILTMKFSEVDYQNKIWKIPKTKNGISHTIPLIDNALNIIQERHNKAINDWVFYSSKSKTGHLVEPKKAWKLILAKAQIQNLRLHDLRRTLGSLMASTGANSYIISKALGHKSSKATDIYARLSLEPVRESIVKATSFFNVFG